jgi:hypothetical protein
MAYTDRALLKQVQVGQILGDKLVDPTGEVGRMHQREYVFNVSDAATPATLVAEWAIPVQNAGKVVGAKLTVPVAVTGSDTLFASFIVSKRTAAGGAVAVCTFLTKLTPAANVTGTLVAFVPFDGSANIVAAAAQLATGDVLTFSLAKASTGTAISGATSFATVAIVVEEN